MSLGRLFSALAITAFLSIAPLGCDDSKSDEEAAAKVSPAIQQANQNMMDSMKAKAKKK
jgi:hypothetical protein